MTRDNFPRTIDLLDEAIQAVAALDEPASQNFVRKHTLERLAESGGDSRHGSSARGELPASSAAMPGTYSAGRSLAVYASAWKTEKDLADVFFTGTVTPMARACTARRPTRT